MTTDTIETNDAETTESAGAETTVDPMRVLKVATTTSLSNRSTLGYAIGCDDSNAIFISLRSNSAAGMFSKNWIAYVDIADALTRADKLTSSTLLPLYEYTSRNNAGFLAAVLKEEGLIEAGPNRGYQCRDFKPFVARVQSMMKAGVDLGDADLAIESHCTVDAIEDQAIAEQAIEVPVIAAGKRGRPSKRT
jgi:hypothetical protein